MLADVSLALLIGGRGTRLGGVDKATLMIAGRGIGETVIATFAPLTRTTFVVGRADQREHPLARAHALAADAVADEGPLRAIATALAYSPTPWVFVVACDATGLTAHDLLHLAGERRRGRCAIAWTTPAGSEPLCALYSRALSGRAHDLLAHGERRARALLIGEHTCARPQPIGNLNTPADLP